MLYCCKTIDSNNHIVMALIQSNEGGARNCVECAESRNFDWENDSLFLVFLHICLFVSEKMIYERYNRVQE